MLVKLRGGTAEVLERAGGEDTTPQALGRAPLVEQELLAAAQFVEVFKGSPPITQNVQDVVAGHIESLLRGGFLVLIEVKQSPADLGQG